MKLENEFKEMLRDSYFCPSMNYVFKNVNIKFTARCAMRVLWNKEKFLLGDKEFSNAQIRDIILNKMMSEHFCVAIEMFENLNRYDGVEILAYLIFVVILVWDNLMVLLAEYDMKVLNQNSKGGIV